MHIDYYIDESGHAGDVAGGGLDFGGQPVFALACVGIKNLETLEKKIILLKKTHRIQADELKMTSIYNSKPKFIVDVFKYIDSEKMPVFIEIVDKKYLLAANIVNTTILPPYFCPIETREDLDFRRLICDYIYENFSDNIFLEFIEACKKYSEIALLKFISKLDKFLTQLNDEISKSLLEHVKENLGSVDVSSK